MQEVKKARGWLVGLLLCTPLAAQLDPGPWAGVGGDGASEATYLRLESGSWMIGGLEDLGDLEGSLIFIPRACHEDKAYFRFRLGFTVDETFDSLDIAGDIEAASPLDLTLGFRNWKTGKCVVLSDLRGVKEPFRITGLEVESDLYRSGSTLEVELCVSLVSSCGPPPTDEDAVSVQDLSIEPPKGGAS